MIGPNNVLAVEDQLIVAARQVVVLLAELDNAVYAEDVLRVRWEQLRDSGLDHESAATWALLTKARNAIGAARAAVCEAMR